MQTIRLSLSTTKPARHDATRSVVGPSATGRIHDLPAPATLRSVAAIIDGLAYAHEGLADDLVTGLLWDLASGLHRIASMEAGK